MNKKKQSKNKICRQKMQVARLKPPARYMRFIKLQKADFLIPYFVIQPKMNWF